MFVGQRMSHPVITAYPEMTMLEAMELMHQEQIRRLPVVDKHGKLAGIIAERTLLKAMPSEATTLSVWEIRDKMTDMTIEKFMTHDVTTVIETTPLEEAARIMIDQDITGLPVVDGEKLVGFITQRDIFRVFMETLGAREPGVRITALVSKDPGTIYHLAQAIYELGGDIRSFSTFLGENSENGEAIIKVAGVKKEDLLKAIMPFVEKLVDIR